MPSGASHDANDGLAEPSSAMRFTVSFSTTPSRADDALSSTNSSPAPQSRTIAASCSGVDDGASGQAAAPMRRAATNTVTYSIEDGLQIATAPLLVTPSRCIAAAARSMSASNWAKVSTRSPSMIARWVGRSFACARIMSGMVEKGCSRSSAAVVMRLFSREARLAFLAEGSPAFLEVFAVEAGVDGLLGHYAK